MDEAAECTDGVIPSLSPAEAAAPTPSERYLQASAEFAALVMGSELTKIAQYAADAETRANNLGTLWLQDPYQREAFIREAEAIVEESDGIGDRVTTLKNTVVRFVRAARPEYAGRMPVRSRGKHQRTEAMP